MNNLLLVGLGNPGARYLWTRHNAGFIVLDAFSHAAGIDISRKNFGGLYGEGSYRDRKVFLLKPQTFMNLSGRSVNPALRFHKLAPHQLLVIHDDMDIPFGQIKIKEGGGHGGHNGLRSITQELGGGGFNRLRIGVGRPSKGDPADYVLSPFTKDEMDRLPDLLHGVVGVLQMLLVEGIPKAMSNYNGKTLIEG